MKSTLSSFTFILMLLICTMGTSTVQAQQANELVSPKVPLPPESNAEQEGYLINFPNVNIIEYIRFISQITKKKLHL